MTRKNIYIIIGGCLILSIGFSAGILFQKNIRYFKGSEYSGKRKERFQKKIEKDIMTISRELALTKDQQEKLNKIQDSIFSDKTEKSENIQRDEIFKSITDLIINLPKDKNVFITQLLEIQNRKINRTKTIGSDIYDFINVLTQEQRVKLADLLKEFHSRKQEKHR